MTVRFAEAARREFNDTVLYYEDQRRGLGAEFADAIQTAIDEVLAFPQAFARIEAEVRKCAARRFPYAVLYSIEGEEIWIVAVMHQHRDPDYWKERVGTQE